MRSDHAHADLLEIETEAALARPGVAAVLTGADMAEDGVGSMPCLWKIPTKDGTPMAEPPRWALARGRVRHVGEPVAAVLAESQAAADDAAELVGVRYAPLPAVVGSRAAVGAETVLHDEAPGNVCYVWGRGDEAAVARAMETAARTVEIDIYNNRIAGAALEPRAAIASYDSIAGTVTLYDTTQAVHLVRRSVAAQLGMADREIRVISPDVGGGFGYKGKHYPEEIVVCWAARRLGRPVRWVGTRGEAFVTDTQARDHRTRAKLALDGDGRFLGLRVETVADLGAYLSTFGAAIPSAIYSALLAGVYGTPAVYVEVTGVFTNTVPTDAYRGAGRPEACYILERLADRAAAAAGVDPVEIRRRNLIPGRAMPYTTPIGPTYDCGDFPKIMERALASADHGGFAERRAASEAKAGCAASGSRASSNPPASRRPGSPARWARASGSSNRPRSGSTARAACRRCSAPTITARATPPPSRRS